MATLLFLPRRMWNEEEEKWSLVFPRVVQNANVTLRAREPTVEYDAAFKVISDDVVYLLDVLLENLDKELGKVDAHVKEFAG